jgi:hypothetical protein
MKGYYFTVTIAGHGEGEHEAWRDAVESFSLDPGCPPEDFDIDKEEPE